MPLQLTPVFSTEASNGRFRNKDVMLFEKVLDLSVARVPSSQGEHGGAMPFQQLEELRRWNEFERSIVDQ